MENNKELFESIFNRNAGGADTPEYLENIAREYPYFTPAQFYLLLHTKKDNPLYGRQVQKTAALFNNNYWLNYLLITAAKTEQVVEFGFKAEETIADTLTDVDTNPATPGEEIAPPVPDETSTEPDHDAEEQTLVADEEVPLMEPPIAEETQAVENDSISVTGETPVSKEPVISEPEELTTEPSIGGNNNENIEETVAVESEPGNEIDEPVPVEKNRIENSIPADAVTTAKAADENKNEMADEPSETMLFQPLYTSDYFASVGIKLSEEANSSDRLGKQLKSFTQWLKTMKKIDTRSTDTLLPPEIGSENIDTNIQTLAENSNKDNEIITEAMADVLIQQGRITKAVEVLKKLSLLNPSKSTYFAAKIDQLKDS